MNECNDPFNKAEAWREIEALVAEGMASPVEEMTEADWDELDSIIDRVGSRDEGISR